MPGTVIPSLVFARSATSDLSRDWRSRGERHRPHRPRRRRPRRRARLPTSSSSPISPAMRCPSATTCAPVRVATSTIASGCSSLAAASASAITSRPSASVFSTSTVVPPCIRSTSFGRIGGARRHVLGEAEPARDPHRHPRARRARRSPTARRQPRPCRSSCRPSTPPGFSERPPESNVMPLPTSARCTDAAAGAYSRRTSRGPRLEPRPTPRMPPKPSASSAVLVPDPGRRRPPASRGLDRELGEPFGGQVGGRRVHEVLRASHAADDGADAIEAIALVEVGVQGDPLTGAFASARYSENA